jgi:hypothetical protein
VLSAYYEISLSGKKEGNSDPYYTVDEPWGLNEFSQSQNDKLCRGPLIWGTYYIVRIIETK